MLQTQRTIKLWSIAAAGVLFAAAMLASAGSHGALADQATRLAAIGQTAPGFDLVNAQTGDKTLLDTAREGKKATVLIFISTRCPVSNAYNDRMIALADKYGPQGVAVIGIYSNQTEPIAEVASHAQSNKFTFPVLKDSDDSVADAYNARRTPTAYVIDAQGVVRDKFIAVPNKLLHDVVVPLLLRSAVPGDSK